MELQPALKRMAKDIDILFDTWLKVPEDSRDRLYEAMRHAAIGGGKRIRPMLVLAASKLFNVDHDSAMRAVANAIAILVAPLRVEREIIVCWIGAHGRSAVRRNWGGVNRRLHT